MSADKTNREYWDQRAQVVAGALTATTNDVYLRELELKTLLRVLETLTLPSGAQILDLGCGDGWTTMQLASAFPDLFFCGVDFSEQMIINAKKKLSDNSELNGRVIFCQGDATKLKDVCGETLYDVIITDRCIINLASEEQQFDVIAQISKQLKESGCYLAIENFVEGHERMNQARLAMGIPPIPVRWHNLYLHESRFFRQCARLYDVVLFDHFASAYYFATRVLYSALCFEKEEQPDYCNPIHRLAIDLPDTGQFSPVCLTLLRKRTEVSDALGGDVDVFAEERRTNIESMSGDLELRRTSLEWVWNAARHKYGYNFDWAGRPIIQFPEDIIVMQEIIWKVKPDLILETGIAHGGSLIFYASMLEMIGGEGYVVGVDIDIREHNRIEIEKHPMFKRITMFEGSSIDDAIVRRVRNIARGKKRVLVVLDSNHTHAHVLRELAIYSPMVTKGSYLVVFDTIVEDMPDELFLDRPWGKGNNPKTAVWEFLRTNNRFVIDKEIENKLLITVAPDGYLMCVEN